MGYNCISTEFEGLALIVGVNSTFLNEGTGSGSPRDLENTLAPRSATGDQEPQFRQRATPEVFRGVPWASRRQLWAAARAGSRWVGAGGSREPWPQMQWRRARKGTPDLGTPRAGSAWGARARARSRLATALQLRPRRPVEGSGAPTLASSGPCTRAHPRAPRLATPCPKARPLAGNSSATSSDSRPDEMPHVKIPPAPTLEGTSAFPSYLCSGRQVRPRNCPKGT